METVIDMFRKLGLRQVLVTENGWVFRGLCCHCDGKPGMCLGTTVLRQRPEIFCPQSFFGVKGSLRERHTCGKLIKDCTCHLQFWKLIHTHTRLTALCPGLPGWVCTRKVKPIWILLKQETMSGSGISWAIWKFAPRSRQITTPAPHHSVFRPDALPVAQSTASKQIAC